MTDAKPISRQRLYQMRMQYQARCISCGGGKLAESSDLLCEKDLLKARVRARKRWRRLGIRPWRKGHKGRPPLSIPSTVERK